MARDFDKWLMGFRDSIADYKWYVDFDKVYKNVGKLKRELNLINSLIGSENIEKDFISLVTDYPKVLKVVPIMLAVRSKEIFVITGEQKFNYNFSKVNYTPEQYSVFMKETGLFELLSSHLIANTVDYVTGVETGLDTNARKNRTGHVMENLVESFIVKAGFVKDKDYFKEITTDEITSRWGLNLSAISFDGKTQKRFDFAVKTADNLYGIETNFYSSQGSKLNETARSYKTLAIEAKTIEHFSFVWFTDGKGWHTAKNNLHETFDVLEHIYNIADMESGIMKKVFV